MTDDVCSSCGAKASTETPLAMLKGGIPLCINREACAKRLAQKRVGRVAEAIAKAFGPK